MEPETAMEHGNTVFLLILPAGVIGLLLLMTSIHRGRSLKYLYLVNILFLIAEIASYFVLAMHPVGEDFPEPWMDSILYIWLGGLVGGYALSILSCVIFAIERARKHLWARIALGIGSIAWTGLCVYGVYLLILGILSLKIG
jgi:hypothetical protein